MENILKFKVNNRDFSLNLIENGFDDNFSAIIYLPSIVLLLLVCFSFFVNVRKWSPKSFHCRCMFTSIKYVQVPTLFCTQTPHNNSCAAAPFFYYLFLILILFFVFDIIILFLLFFDLHFFSVEYRKNNDGKPVACCC